MSAPTYVFSLSLASVLLLSACGGGSSATGSTTSDTVGDDAAGQPGTDSGAPDDVDAPPPDTPPDGSQSGNTLNRDNAIELIGQVFAVFAGSAYDARIFDVPIAPERFAGQISSGTENNFTVTTFSCANGGTAESRIRSEGAQTLVRMRFEQCLEGTSTYDGEFTLSQQPAELTYGVPALLIQDQASTFELEGTYVSSLPAAESSLWRTVEFGYAERTASGNLVVENASTEYSANGNQATLSGSFSVRPPAVNGLPVGVSTPEPLAMHHQAAARETATRLVNPAFSAGQLGITADDGSSLTVQAVSADTSLARITLSNASGTESFDQAWSVWETALTRQAER